MRSPFEIDRRLFRSADELLQGKASRIPASRSRRLLPFVAEELDETRVQEEILPPVDWVESLYHAGPQQYELWPGVKKSFIELTTKFFFEEHEKPFNLAVLSGGIGAGKTRIAEAFLHYTLYYLLCHANPPRAIGLPASAIINIALFNVKLEKAKKVMFKRLSRYIRATPWFKEKYPPNPQLKNSLDWTYLDRSIIVSPYSSTVASAISEDMWIAVLDEANFWTASSETDLIDDVYFALRRRMRSRFETESASNWLIMLVSSASDDRAFTDRMEPEADYVLKSTKWDAKGITFANEKKFFIVIPKNSAPYILQNEESHIPGAARVLKVPERFRNEAEADISNFLRENYGIGVKTAKRLYGEWLRDVLWDDPIKDEFLIDPDVFPPMPRMLDHDANRYIHVDLAVTNDWCAIACGFVEDTQWKEIEEGLMELIPHIYYDFVIRWHSYDRNVELPIEKIRELILEIAKSYSIVSVTYDGWQSKDSIQLLNKKGIPAAYLSVDRTPDPHQYLKRLLYEKRISAPRSENLIRELENLIVDEKSGKVDHPSKFSKHEKGTKDMADAMAGVAWGIHQGLEGKAKHFLNPAELEVVVIGKSSDQID